MYAIGRVSTLRLYNPDGEVVVVVLFPKPIDESWHPGFGHSGNKDDVTHWEDVDIVRFQGDSETGTLTVKWEYSSRSQKLRIGDTECDLPRGKVAVISFGDDLKPECSVRDGLPEVIEVERQKRSQEIKQAQPARPLP